MDEARLIDKLQLIEALFAGVTTEGEKVATEQRRFEEPEQEHEQAQEEEEAQAALR